MRRLVQPTTECNSWRWWAVPTLRLRRFSSENHYFIGEPGSAPKRKRV